MCSATRTAWLSAPSLTQQNEKALRSDEELFSSHQATTIPFNPGSSANDTVPWLCAPASQQGYLLQGLQYSSAL